jgi:hypothetical protein
MGTKEEHPTVKPIIDAGVKRLRYLECQIYDVSIPDEPVPCSDERSIVWQILRAADATWAATCKQDK